LGTLVYRCENSAPATPGDFDPLGAGQGVAKILSSSSSITSNVVVQACLVDMAPGNSEASLVNIDIIQSGSKYSINQNPKT
jgi:hypothetical protein